MLSKRTSFTFDELITVFSSACEMSHNHIGSTDNISAHHATLLLYLSNAVHLSHFKTPLPSVDFFVTNNFNLVNEPESVVILDSHSNLSPYKYDFMNLWNVFNFTIMQCGTMSIQDLNKTVLHTVVSPHSMFINDDKTFYSDISNNPLYGSYIRNDIARVDNYFIYRFYSPWLSDNFVSFSGSK